MVYIIEDINTDFINELYNEILIYNNDNNMNVNMCKLIIPYPKSCTHPSDAILKMNNLIIMQKI